MITTFAYSDKFEHEYDARIALYDSTNPATFFSLDIARIDGDGLTGHQFSVELLDNEKFETKTRQRTTTTIITRQNLVLHGVKLSQGIHRSKTVNFRTLLEEWYYARSRWFYPDALKLPGDWPKLMKVVRGQDNLDFIQDRKRIYLLMATIKIETANSK